MPSKRKADDAFTKLEHAEKLRRKSYQEALIAAKAEHDRIRRAAHRAQEWNLLQIEKAKQQQEDAEAREIERQRLEHLEQEIVDRRRRAEEAHRLEELSKQAEIEQRQHDEEAKRRAEERAQREAQRQAEEAKLLEASTTRPVDEASAKTAHTSDTQLLKDNQTCSDAQQSNGISIGTRQIESSSTDSLVTTTKETMEKEHNDYLKMHRWLKTMRKDVERDAKADPRLKPLLGDWRREIKKTVGQLTLSKGGTMAPRNKILDILKRARSQSKTSIEPRHCFAKGLPPGLNDASAQIPSLLVYYLNILSKAVINQWASEGSAKIEAADPPGILITFLFAVDDTKFQGHALIDILLAKLHRVCPVLFGIYGNEKTDAGRARLGWERECDSDSLEKTRWSTEQRHNDRMLGLGAGYASISLRDFSRAPMPNPYPSVHYWCAIARIINTPRQDLTQSHLIVLKALIEKSVERFAKFYGKAAQVALRSALISFPQRAPEGPAKVGLTTLPDILRKTHGLRL